LRCPFGSTKTDDPLRMRSPLWSHTVGLHVHACGVGQTLRLLSVTYRAWARVNHTHINTIEGPPVASTSTVHMYIIYWYLRSSTYVVRSGTTCRNVRSRWVRRYRTWYLRYGTVQQDPPSGSSTILLRVYADTRALLTVTILSREYCGMVT
jgi:hypothetical protein